MKDQSDQEINVKGVVLRARSDKTLYWPDRETLFAADLHLGKGAAFRAGDIPIPEGTTEETLRILDAALSDTKAKRLIVLGDLWHSKAGRDEGTRKRFATWRAQHPNLEVRLIVGNHDAKSGPLENEGFQVDAELCCEGPFVYAHHPQAHPDGYVLCGHLHPGAVLVGRARQSIKLPCFWFGQSFAVLPSLGAFTGCSAIRPLAGDRLIIVVDDRVVSMTAQ
ncbi:ligase-associated DNA damage response endonuclease PdeM [soil metagenome]